MAKSRKKSTPKGGTDPYEPEIRCGATNELLNGKPFDTLILSRTDGLYYEKLPAGHVSGGDQAFTPKAAKEALEYTRMKDWDAHS